MNSFKAAPPAAKLTAAIGRLALRVLDGLCRHLPQSKSTPW